MPEKPKKSKQQGPGDQDVENELEGGKKKQI